MPWPEQNHCQAQRFRGHDQGTASQGLASVPLPLRTAARSPPQRPPQRLRLSPTEHRALGGGRLGDSVSGSGFGTADGHYAGGAFDYVAG